MVNVPFVDGWALRLVGWKSERAGFIDTRDPFEPDYNEGDTRAGGPWSATRATASR